MNNSADDSIDDAIAQWGAVLPELDFSSLHIVSRMLRIIRIFERDREPILRAVGLQPWSFDTLAVIRRQVDGTITAGELAQAVVVSLGTMTTRLVQLEKNDWVKRTPAQRDRRVVEVSLTPAGQRRFDAVLAEVLACQRAISAMLDDSETAVLITGLRALTAGAEDPHAAVASDTDAAPAA